MDYNAAKAFILGKLAEELSPQLTYHGMHHTLDVLSVTEELCEKEEVNEYDCTLLKTAALFHDSGFTINNREHEHLGCEIARKHLPRYNYSPTEIKQICGMIMATKIPQTPHNFLESILCDADLDYLGREDFYEIGDTLFEELKAYGVLDTEESWNRLQVSFLESHAFFTQTNRERRGPRKNAYLEELKELVSTYRPTPL